MKRVAVAATFVGAIVGAGFASGREIALYFAETSVLTPILSGVLLGLFCYLFAEIGRVTNAHPELLSKNLSRPIEWVIRLENAVTFCAMIAGSEEIVKNLFGIPGGGVVTGIIALLVVVCGADKVKWSNILIVPTIIVLVFWLFARTSAPLVLKKISFLSAFSYCTMNIMGGGYLVSTYSGQFEKKDSVVTSIIAGTVITLLLVAVYSVVSVAPDAVMPLLSAAEGVGLSTVANVVAYLAVFTTLTGSLSIAAKNNPYSAVLVTALSFVVSLFGFRTLVDKAYPILGAIGAVVSLAYAALYFKFRYQNRSKSIVPAITKTNATNKKRTPSALYSVRNPLKNSIK